MMETFLVLGLCFIIYEALDFFQGCLHSTSPNSTDQIEAYRRQLDEQRQQLQQEQFIANLTPLLGAQLLAATSSVSLTPSDSTASIISEQLRAQQQREQLEQQLAGSIRSSSCSGAPSNAGDNSLSTPALHSSGLGSTFGSAAGSGSLSVASGNSSGAAFRPAYRSAYESQELYATSSLPRDYYFLQQQQQKNKHSARSLFSKFGASNSDNRIFPETTAVLGVPAGVITQQPAACVVNHFECLPPATVPASPLAVDLKRAILSNNNKNRNSNNNNKTYNERRRAACAVESVLVHGVAVIASPSRDPPNPTATTTTTSVKRANQRNRNANASAAHTTAHDSDGSTSDCESDTSGDSSDSSASASAGSASLASCGEDSDPGLGEEREFGLSNSCSSSHADFREIECERLRRKCVSVKRIYSISEKF
ncbi:PREDICTED: probable serine/threonine-protein kinase dyrk2 [Bactrocera latifrons]|uniref:probable serine/threonine-protein kinase dyrk2 n=1 Tax=Bactrocera latifrons TaxID=174628 RepID=UPI0008DD2AD8|nr:PREDICTED: probable serine/threonine-protein kinase dyrk2 [Bactrocera latifrons]XP_018790924.1 PREDICTED: probable serine/threonine-protein kinase dyrk2 [Bactrocera latifrons]XP_018791013.1 PREDICTED: probable serine/threonine-protein kinase dyrk2 [Bactrocera latifrons]